MTDSKLAQLIEGLDSENRDMRLYSAHELGAFGPEAKGAVPKLLSLMNSSDETTTGVIIDTLREIGPSKEVVAAFIEVLSGDSIYLKNSVISVLTVFEDEAIDAKQALEEAKADPKLFVRAVYALSRMDPESRRQHALLDEAFQASKQAQEDFAIAMETIAAYQKYHGLMKQVPVFCQHLEGMFQ